MMLYMLPLVILLCVSSSSEAFRGLPSLPGYLTAFGSDGNTEDQISNRFYSRGVRVKNYPRYGGLENLAEPKDVGFNWFYPTIIL